MASNNPMCANFGEESIETKWQKLAGAFKNLHELSEELLSQNVQLVQRVRESGYACSLAMIKREDWTLKINELNAALSTLNQIAETIVKQNTFLLERLNSKPDSYLPVDGYGSTALAPGEEDDANEGQQNSNKWQMLKRLFSDITAFAESLSSQNAYLTDRLKEIDHEQLGNPVQLVIRYQGGDEVRDNAHKCYQIREAFEEAIINLETLAMQNTVLMQLWKFDGSHANTFDAGQHN
uniref:Uncharacterized protein n=1 Tax=Ditylenchus dipsaci TaxID=166011 RepID=A0A915DZ94_9BILA